MAQEAVVSDVDRANGVHLTRRLTLGSELCCTTIQGNTFRGNLVAQDEETMLIVISILLMLVALCIMISLCGY